MRPMLVACGHYQSRLCDQQKLFTTNGDLEHRSGLQPPTTSRCSPHKGLQAAAACPSGCSATLQTASAAGSSTGRG